MLGKGRIGKPGEELVLAQSTSEIKKETVVLFEEYFKATDESTKIFLENDIISLNMNFALHKASQYRHTCLEEEDIIAAAMTGLMYAVRTFNPEKAQFSTYANRVMQNEVNDALRKASRKKFTDLKPISLNQESSHSSLCQMDTVVDRQVNIEGNFIEENQFQNLLELCQAILNDTEWTVLDNFLKCRETRMSQYDLGVLLSSSQTTISRVEKRAFKKVREFLENQEWGLDILH